MLTRDNANKRWLQCRTSAWWFFFRISFGSFCSFFFFLLSQHGFDETVIFFLCFIFCVCLRRHFTQIERMWVMWSMWCQHMERLMPQHLNLHVKSVLNGRPDDNTKQSKMLRKFARFFFVSISLFWIIHSLNHPKKKRTKKIKELKI